MSKKFIFFKLFDNLNDSCETEVLSRLELSSFFDEFDTIQNVFQLQQFPDLKLLINKNENLQHLLTQNLPGQGFRHGYLWSGEDFGDLTKILAKIAFFKECFLFQRSTDPLPFGHTNVYFQLTHRIEIYNWYIFHLYSFQHFLTAANVIRQNANSEIELDRAFRKLWEDTKCKDITTKVHDLNTPEWIPVPKTQFSFLNKDKRAYVKNTDSRWVRALINYIAPGDQHAIYHPFCGTGETLIESRIAGQAVAGSDVNPIRVLYARGNLAAFDLNLQELIQAISTMISQLKMLITANDDTQTDLFLSSAEKQFNQFWEAEKNRIRAFKFNSTISENIKILAAIRFLIESKIISKAAGINAILLSGLVNFSATLMRKPMKTDTITGFHRELRMLYLDIYTYHKIKQLAYIPRNESLVLNESAIHARKLSDSHFDTALCVLPSAISNSGFQNDQILIDLLNFDINTIHSETQKLGNQSAIKGKTASWLDDLLNKGPMYTLLGPYAQKLLLRYYNPKRQTETAALFKLWIDYYYFLLEIRRTLKDQATFCLILNHPHLKIDDKVEEFKISEIIREFLEIHSSALGLNLEQIISKPVAYTHFGQIRHIHLLFLTRTTMVHSGPVSTQ